jgi:hypothetical protein
MFVIIALDPENSPDTSTTAAAGGAKGVTTSSSTNHITIPATAAKRTLRASRIEPVSSKSENDGDTYSRISPPIIYPLYHITSILTI